MIAQDNGFCVAPWTNLHIHPSGTVRPCCISPLKLANLREGETLENAWTSEAAKNLRQEFLRGERPKSCQSCYDREKSGVESVRLQMNERYKSESIQLTNDAPALHNARQLDISFTNDCNLTCKICGPQCSAKWINLAKNLEPDPNPRLWNWYLSPNWTRFELTAQDLAEQLKKFPGIVDFEIKGGEPFISKQHDEFLKLLGELPQAGSFMFRYVTNGTHISPKTVEALGKFNEKHLWVSVDGTGDLYKYIRGGKIGLDTIERTLKTLAKIPGVKLGIVFTLSNYNIFGIQDFWRWYQDQRTQLPELDLFLGMVRSPDYLSVSSFPMSLRKQALERMPDEDHPFLNSIRTALAKPSAAEASVALENFRDFTKTIEKTLNESIVSLHPEFAELLNIPEMNSGAQLRP